jgi:replicative DNA helicase
VPPHSTENEVAIIGAMMLDKGAISKVIEILDTNSFYNEANKIIFETILTMFEKGINVDILTLGEELQRRKMLDYIGGTYYLTEINAATPTAANVEFHAFIVQEKYLKRMLIGSASKILSNCYDESTDALEEIDYAERLVFEIAEKRFSRSYVELKKLAHDAYAQIAALYERDQPGLTGIPTGYKDLDEMLGGFQKSDFIVIAGRPSMGKTALGLSIARNTAMEFKHPVGFFSIEMSSIQLVIRLISAEARINQQKIRTGKISQEELSKIVRTLGKLANTPILIDDSPTLSVMELRAKARRMKAEHGIGMIMVDYLQLLHSTKAESREREISMISRSMKQIAKELDIPVVALAQLNRTVESRSDKRPFLSDLRESGSIEQDADVVIFVHRPEVYGIKTFENQQPTENMAEIIIGKQRNGPIGTVQLAYLKDYARFENVALHFSEPPGEVPDHDDEDAPF